MHWPARKRSLRNQYTVTNLMEVLECDILDMQSLSKYDTYRYILSVIDVFSKYLHLVPIKTKSGPAVTSAFRSLLHDDSPRHLWVRIDKGKEFLNKYLQDILREEGNQFQVCRNPDVKCAVAERVHRTISDRLLKFFTFWNSYRYIDVLPKFVKAYNDTVRKTTGRAPSRATDADVHTIWRLTEARRLRVRVASAKLRVGQNVRNSKGKMKFARAAEHNFSTEIFRIVKLIHRRPRVVNELEDLNGTPIDGEFYSEELTLVRSTKRKTYKINKILDKKVRRGIPGVLVNWQA